MICCCFNLITISEMELFRIYIKYNFITVFLPLALLLSPFPPGGFEFLILSSRKSLSI